MAGSYSIGSLIVFCVCHRFLVNSASYKESPVLATQAASKSSPSDYKELLLRVLLGLFFGKIRGERECNSATPRAV